MIHRDALTAHAACRGADPAGPTPKAGSFHATVTELLARVSANADPASLRWIAGGFDALAEWCHGLADEREAYNRNDLSDITPDELVAGIEQWMTDRENGNGGAK